MARFPGEVKVAKIEIPAVEIDFSLRLNKLEPCQFKQSSFDCDIYTYTYGQVSVNKIVELKALSIPT